MREREQSTLARRDFLQGLSALPAVATVTKPAPLAAAVRMPDLNTLWVARQRLLGAYMVAEAASAAAHETLPWWVKPGPSHIRPDGTQVGTVNSYPAIQDATAPRDGSLRMIRPTPATIERDCRSGAFWGPEAEAKAVQVRDRKLAELREREAAALIEKERRNIPALDAASDAACEAWFEAEDIILAIEPTTPAIAAMHIMARVRAEARPDATWASSAMMEIAATGLRGVLSLLTGEIAADAADFIADPERPISLTRAWLGRAPAATQA